MDFPCKRNKKSLFNMHFGLLLLIFIGVPVLGNNATTPGIDQMIINNLFGYANGSYPAAAFAAAPPQAVAVSPSTLSDPDYWDVIDEFSPTSSPEYDKFDWAITRRVATQQEADNFLLSPLGLKLALAILTEAATGSTQAELSSVLGFDMDRTVVRKKFSTIIGSLQSISSQYILNLGSRIYIEDSSDPRQRFAAIALESYKTELTVENFNKPIEAAKHINAWAANLTENKIPKIVDPDDVTNIAVLVINTLYFKGTWRHQFSPNETKPGPFFVSPKVQKQVSYMNIKDRFYYADSVKFDAKILRLPYLGNKFSMYIIVPNAISGLSHVLSQLSVLRAEMNYLQDSLVDVTLPKFEFDYTSVLDSVLKELGIRQAFEDTASFPGLARGQSLQQRLKISRVLQRSGIEVNEAGSVIYSATEISLVNKFGEDTVASHEVLVNKPFLFFIQDEATKQLLFTGRVADPSLTDGALKPKLVTF